MSDSLNNNTNIYNLTRMFYLTLLAQIVDITKLEEVNAVLKNKKEIENSLELVESLIEKYHRYLKPKKDWETISKNLFDYVSNGNYEGLLKSNPFDLLNPFLNNFKGIPLIVLIENFDVTDFLEAKIQLSDLPVHGYVVNSVGHTAETHILLNACHFMKKARMYFKRYHELIDGKMVAELDQENKILHNALYQQINFSSIQAFLNMITFVECFVNSAAYNFIIETNPEKEVSDYLLEISEKHSTQKKLLTYPKLINNELVKDIKYYWSSNKNRINEEKNETPYQADLKSFTELHDHRDSYIHYSPNQNIKKPKSSIILTPIDWYNYAENSFQVCIKIAKQFWLECGHKDGPHYLYDLDENELEQAGLSSVIQEIQVLSDLINKGYFS